MTSHDPKDSERIAAMAADPEVTRLARELFQRSCEYRYSYNFSWLGRPVIQYPGDLLALQEIVWRTRPDVIIETGVAHGGGTVFLASILEMLGGDRFVVAVDVEIRSHNREALEQHPLAKRIRLVEGSSVAAEVVSQVREYARGAKSVMVVLDSNHTHDHVLAELRAYSSLVTAGAYLVVLDTVVEWLPKSLFADRPWGPGDNPWTAVQAFLRENDRFVIDQEIANKLLLTVAPDGYLRCIRDDSLEPTS